MNKSNKIFSILSYVFIGIFIFMLFMLVAQSVMVIPGVIILVVSVILSLTFGIIDKLYKDGILPKDKKSQSKSSNKKAITKEEKERAKANDKKLKSFAGMPFIEQFKAFLEILGIDHTKYAAEKFKTKDKRNLGLYDINSANIKDFSWAKFLAEKHELIWIDNKQDTLDSLTEFEKYKDGFIKKYLKENKLFKLGYYRDDIKHNDSERFEYAKDMKYFLRDICGIISCYRSTLVPIYIETDDPDVFLFGIYNNPKREGLDYVSTKNLRFLAESLGLYAFPAGGSFPETVRKTLDHDDYKGNGILAQKNYMLETRNDKLIEELNEKKKAQRAKDLEEFLNKQEPEIQKNDNFVPITHGFKSEDEIECFIFGKKHKLRVASNNKEDGELLDDDEIGELNWAISNNIMDDKKVQFKVLEAINERYDMALGDGASHKTNLKREFDITTIMIDIQKDDMGDTGEVSKVIAFCGESKCDTEHGLSVSFADRKFAGVNSFMEFNYVETDNSFNYLKWKEENPLTGMVPKFSNVLIKSGFTDDRKVCFFSSIYYGEYSSIKNKLKKMVIPSKELKEKLVHHAVSVKGDKIFLFKVPYGKELADCLDEYTVISKDEIIDNFILEEDYKINDHQTNHFLNLHFVLKDNRILVLTSFGDDPIMKFLNDEFGVKK